MAPESTPVSIDQLVESASGDFLRILHDLTRRLQDDHARTLAEALESARVAAEREKDAAVRDAIARARETETAERRELETRLRAEGEEALAAARAETEARLQAQSAEALAAARLETEAHVRAESVEAVAMAVAAAEQRVQQEAALTLARATDDLEQRLQADSDSALKQAREDFERRLAVLGDATNAASVVAPAVAEVGAGERESRLQSLERLLRAIERVDGASSLREALDALASGAAEEAPRSVVMIVNGRVLRGWRANCPGAPADFAKLEVPLEFAGPLGEAVSSGAVTAVHANLLSHDTRGALSFLQLAEDQAGLAVPLTVDGRVVAIVYADDGAVSDREVPGSWPESVQVLARHAASVLAALTARRAAAMKSTGTAPRHAPDEGSPAPLTKSA